MNCRYCYTNEDGKPLCSVNDFTQCPFAWWCTNDLRWKDYEGSEHCGLAIKSARDGWFLVKEWRGDTAVCYNGKNIIENIKVEHIEGDKPKAIKIGEFVDGRLAIADAIY